MQGATAIGEPVVTVFRTLPGPEISFANSARTPQLARASAGKRSAPAV
jgi:hypothetical protein